jgi:epoxyqueuosine reductase
MLKDLVTEFAIKQGFDLVKIAPAKIEGKYVEAFDEWLDKKYEASMEYMQKSAPRRDIKSLLPRAKSVICLAMNYYHEQPELKKGHGKVARYAYGRDYHKIIKKKLQIIEKFICEQEPNAETLSYVDTGPVLERAFAETAGLGFIGKNSCLITKEFGSWVFLAEIITTAELEPDEPILKKAQKSFAGCGACTSCIDRCPTSAIIAPGVIDASRCISFLTIENRDDIPAPLAKIIAKTRRLYGCDICQEVCPHNAKATPTTHTELLDPPIAGDSLPLKKILAISSDDQYLKTFAGSPLMRAKRKGLQRNAKIL